MDLMKTYDAMLELQEDLRFEIQAATTLEEVSYRTFKALAAALELQEYLAGRVAIARACGKVSEDLAACWPEPADVPGHEFTRDFCRKMHEICPSIDPVKGEVNSTLTDAGKSCPQKNNGVASTA